VRSYYSKGDEGKIDKVGLGLRGEILLLRHPESWSHEDCRADITKVKMMVLTMPSTDQP
jgi:hypothetical protein